MALTNAGRDHIAKAIDGEAPTIFDAVGGTAYIGVGDTATAFDAAQTDLAAPTSKLRKQCRTPVTDPITGAVTAQRVGNVLTFQAVFGIADANWDWKEWAVFNGAAAGTMLSRKVEELEVKASTQSWVMTVALIVVAA
jgi:hypothetical protein